jgi:hypothetical protein
MENQLQWSKITNSSQIFLLKEQWDDLNSSVNKNNLFTSYSWMKNWLDTFQQDHWEYHIFTVYLNKKLVAIAPFYIQKALKWNQPKTLYLLGQGEPDISGVCSEYIDLLIIPEHKLTVIKILAKAIKSLEVDRFICRAVLYDSNISSFISESFHYSLKGTHLRYMIEKRLWALKTLSKNTLSRYKRSINQLNKINAQVCWVEQKYFKSFFQIMEEFHQKRWQLKGQNGAFSHIDFKQFHQQILTKNSQIKIKMSAVLVNGRPIIIHYYLSDQTTLYFYQSGWDEENHSKLSLGMFLHLWSIQSCEHKYYDFMMGNIESSYKAKFICEEIPMTNIEINFTQWKNYLNKILTKASIYMKLWSN